MGFFSKLKKKARGQIAPVMPMAPQPLPRVPVMPQRPIMPEALPPRRGPRSRGLPSLMNQMEGDPRMMMAAGGPSVVGRALSQRFKNPSKAVLGVRGRNIPDRMMPGIGDRILGSPGLNDRLRRGTENAIIAGGAGGAALLADGTQMFREPFSKENTRSFMSPEAFGKDMAQMRMDVGAVINFARNKANEVGANINEYVNRARSAYDQEMENQRMQELDAEQGMQPFSLLMGPDMPLFRPEETDPRVDRMIESGMGSSESLDDILSDLEKKN